MQTTKNPKNHVKQAKTRNMIWSIPAILFLITGVCFLIAFVLNFYDVVSKGEGILVSIASSKAAPFLTLSIFTLILGGIFKICAYLSGIYYTRINESSTPIDNFDKDITHNSSSNNEAEKNSSPSNESPQTASDDSERNNVDLINVTRTDDSSHQTPFVSVKPAPSVGVKDKSGYDVANIGTYKAKNSEEKE